ncbi:MAG: hypothetical protein ABR899_06035, partial [Candidatus Krumholzibacteriaceae bacterium]
MHRGIGIPLSLFGRGVAPAPGTPAGAAQGRESALEPVLERLSKVGHMILSDAPVREIFDEMVRALAEDTGTSLVILRIAKPGG